jgi:hypothetical protein
MRNARVGMGREEKNSFPKRQKNNVERENVSALILIISSW